MYSAVIVGIRIDETPKGTTPIDLLRSEFRQRFLVKKIESQEKVREDNGAGSLSPNSYFDSSDCDENAMAPMKPCSVAALRHGTTRGPG